MLEEALNSCYHGDHLISLLYARRSNDERLARALLGFARDRTDESSRTDEAKAVLEVAESTLDGTIGKDVCSTIADNFMDDAYDRFLSDKRFDQYFSCHCIGSAARLVATVTQPESVRDAVEVVRSAISVARLTAPGDDGSEVRRAAASRIRAAVGA